MAPLHGVNERSRERLGELDGVAVGAMKRGPVRGSHRRRFDIHELSLDSSILGCWNTPDADEQEPMPMVARCRENKPDSRQCPCVRFKLGLATMLC